MRARCGRCAGTVDLHALRPYRVRPVGPVRAEDVARAAAHLPIGLDDPSLAGRIVSGLATPPPRSASALTWRAEAAAPDRWDEAEPLPEIPEMDAAAGFEPSVAPVTEADIRDELTEGDAVDDLPSRAPSEAGGPATVGLWTMGGAVLGTGVSWTLGGTTMTGVLAGAVLGLSAAWGWLRWMSRP